MKTRSGRTPWSIWIIVALWTVLIAPNALRLGATLSTRIDARTLVVLATLLGFSAYHAIALARLSRWPIVIQVASVIVSLIARHVSHFDWRHRYPMLGPFILIIPLALYLALTLPHWRKMNWALFGRPYRPAEDQVEVFT